MLLINKLVYFIVGIVLYNRKSYLQSVVPSRRSVGYNTYAEVSGVTLHTELYNVPIQRTMMETRLSLANMRLDVTCYATLHNKTAKVALIT